MLYGYNLEVFINRCVLDEARKLWGRKSGLCLSFFTCNNLRVIVVLTLKLPAKRLGIDCINALKDEDGREILGFNTR